LKRLRAQIASVSADISEKISASAALFDERERWILGALVKLAKGF
jgi:hypothetical protein